GLRSGVPSLRGRPPGAPLGLQGHPPVPPGNPPVVKQVAGSGVPGHPVVTQRSPGTSIQGETVMSKPQTPEPLFREITSEPLYLRRRDFLRNAGLGVLTAAATGAGLVK